MTTCNGSPCPVRPVRQETLQLAVLLTLAVYSDPGTDDGKRIGELLALTGSADIVDAHVALITAHVDLVLASDPGEPLWPLGSKLSYSGNIRNSQRPGG